MTNAKYLEIQAVEIYGKDWKDLTKAQKDGLRFYLTQMIINDY